MRKTVRLSTMTGPHNPLVAGSNPVAATSKYKQASVEQGTSLNPRLTRVFAVLRLKNGGDSLMLQRLLGHTTLTMTNRYVQSVGCLDALESHKRYSPVDNLKQTGGLSNRNSKLTGVFDLHAVNRN